MLTKKHLRLIYTVLMLVIIEAGSVFAATFTGKVIGVIDGDTIDVLVAKKTVRVRLHGIDAPERKQAFGTQAKKVASDLCFGKDVTVDKVDEDRYGRTVGIVILPDKSNLNQTLVSLGMAWWYRKYAPNDTKLAELEAEARKAKRGLWSQPNPIPPWEFRKKKKATTNSMHSNSLLTISRA